MDGLEFITSLVRALAWPAAVVVAVLVLRRSLAGMLEVPLKRLRVSPTGVEAEWGQSRDRVVTSLVPSVPGQAETRTFEMRSDNDFAREMLRLATERSPISAVAACEQEIGRQLAMLLDRAGETGASSHSVRELAHAAYERGLITPATQNAVEGLAVMRDLALLEDGGRRLDLGKATEFIGLTVAVLYAIRQPVTRSPGDGER
ncbi:MAG: hypothetical protein ACT4PI_06450 [Actinomycetota bacterium]